MLVEKKGLYLPMKSALNDPTDCEPNIVVERNLISLRGALRRISSMKYSPSFYTSMAEKHLKILDEAAASNQLLFADEEPTGVQRNMPSGDRAFLHVRNFIRSRIGMPRVFSMSAGWDIPQMWSYYADSHRGFCLELSGFPETDSDFLFERVNYADKRPQVVLDDVISLEDGSQRSKRNLSMIYCEKSNAWSEEDEYRIVSRNTKGAQSRTELSLPSGDFYRFPSLKIEGVYFGLRCDEKNIKFVTELFEDRLSAETAPKFYRVEQEADSYDLERIEIKDPLPFWIPTIPEPIQTEPVSADLDDIPF